MADPGGAARRKGRVKTVANQMKRKVSTGKANISGGTAAPAGGLAARLAAARAAEAAKAAPAAGKVSPWVARNLAGQQTPKVLAGAMPAGFIDRKPRKAKSAQVPKPKATKMPTTKPKITKPGPGMGKRKR